MPAQVTQHPTSGATYARNTVPEIVISTNSETVTAVLSVFGGETIFTGSYSPDLSSVVRINLDGLYEELLATDMPSGNVTSQYLHRIMFQCVVSGSESGTIGTYDYYVCNSLLKSSQSFMEFAASHFLTNQPVEKLTCAGAPEHLTWFDHQGDWYIVVRFYSKGGGYEDVVLVTDTTIGVFTMDTSFDRLVRLSPMLPSQLLGYYDVIAFNSKDVEMARQRYIHFERTGRERHYLFINALGGIDTLICEGESILQPEISHNIGRLGGTYAMLDDSEDSMRWSQSVGQVPWRLRDWIYEILSAKQGATAIIAGNDTPIVVTGSEISMADDSQLATASFSYMLASEPCIVNQDERDTDLHASAAASASTDIDDLTDEKDIAWTETIDGYETEAVTIPATKIYVTIPSTETATIHVLINGQLETEIQGGTSRNPVVISTTPGDSVTFETQDTPVGDIVINYYTDEDYVSQIANSNQNLES